MVAIRFEDFKNSFCCHLQRCISQYNYLPKMKKEEKIIIKITNEDKEKSKRNKLILVNLCCCKEEPKIHNIKTVCIKLNNKLSLLN